MTREMDLVRHLLPAPLPADAKNLVRAMDGRMAFDTVLAGVVAASLPAMAVARMHRGQSGDWWMTAFFAGLACLHLAMARPSARAKLRRFMPGDPPKTHLARLVKAMVLVPVWEIDTTVERLSGQGIPLVVRKDRRGADILYDGVPLVRYGTVPLGEGFAGDLAGIFLKVKSCMAFAMGKRRLDVPCHAVSLADHDRSLTPWIPGLPEAVDTFAATLEKTDIENDPERNHINTKKETAS